jgi:nucleotide-binding universal stress UspA family protein
MPAYVILNSARPVLVIPHTAAPPESGLGRRILLAWDGSREAAAAMGASVPLLRRAASVTVLMLAGPLPDQDERTAQQDELLRFLARHRVRPSVLMRNCAVDDGSDAGRVLLSVADELDTDLLVMGCYGHSRLREPCLVGASRIILAESRIPALLVR